MDSRKLTVGQKIKLPGGIASTETPATNHSTSTEAGDAGTYSVKAGDTLTKIAKAHGTTAKKLKAFNNLATDQLQVGRKLKIPAGGATGSVERLASAKPDATTPTNDPVPAPTASTNVLR